MSKDIKRPIVGITQGDSNGIGYEVIIKSLSDERVLDQFTPIVYGSRKLFDFYLKTIHEIDSLPLVTITSAEQAQPRKINVLNCLSDSTYAEPGGPGEEAAKSAIISIERAVEDIKNGLVDTLVTSPINKKSMSAQGFPFPGHTEYLIDSFGVDDAEMLMVSDRIKLAVVTGHIPLREVADSISEEKILRKLRLLKESLELDFSVDNPKIGVLSLNPHSGDGGLLGSEEQDIIIPALRRASEDGIQAYGPFSPDGYFGLGHYQKFDATLAMYHDQGLSPFKTIAFSDGVNFTAGLPIVRTSPDHGTAYEMAGRDLADPSSMRSAIYTSIDILRRRMANQALREDKMIDRTPAYEERQSRSDRNIQ